MASFSPLLKEALSSSGKIFLFLSSSIRSSPPVIPRTTLSSFSFPASSSSLSSSFFSSSSASSSSLQGIDSLPRRRCSSLAAFSSLGVPRASFHRRSFAALSLHRQARRPFSSLSPGSSSPLYFSGETKEEEREGKRKISGELKDARRDDREERRGRERKKEEKKKEEDSDEERCLRKEEKKKKKKSDVSSSSSSSLSSSFLRSLFRDVSSLDAFLSPPSVFPSLCSPLSSQRSSSSSSRSSSENTLYIIHTFRLHPYEFLLLEESLYRLLNHSQPQNTLDDDFDEDISSTSSSISPMKKKVQPTIACVFLHHPPYLSRSLSSSSSSAFSPQSPPPLSSSVPSSLSSSSPPPPLAESLPEELRAKNKKKNKKRGMMKSIIFGLSGRPEAFVESAKSILDEQLAVFIKRFSGGGTVLLDEQEGCLCSSLLLPHSLTRCRRPYPTDLMEFSSRFYQGKIQTNRDNEGGQRRRRRREDEEEEERVKFSRLEEKEEEEGCKRRREEQEEENVFFFSSRTPFSKSFTLKENDFVISSSSPSSASCSVASSLPLKKEKEEKEKQQSRTSSSSSFSSFTSSPRGEYYKVAGNAQALSRLYSLQHTSFIWSEDLLLPLISSFLRIPKKQPAYRQYRSHQSFLKSVKAALKDAIPLPPLSSFRTTNSSEPSAVCTPQTELSSRDNVSDVHRNKTRKYRAESRDYPDLPRYEQPSLSSSTLPSSLSQNSLHVELNQGERGSGVHIKKEKEEQKQEEEKESHLRSPRKQTSREEEEEEEEEKRRKIEGCTVSEKRVLDLKEPRDVLLGISLLAEDFIEHINERERGEEEEEEEEKGRPPRSLRREERREEILSDGTMKYGEVKMPGAVSSSSSSSSSIHREGASNPYSVHAAENPKSLDEGGSSVDPISTQELKEEDREVEREKQNRNLPADIKRKETEEDEEEEEEEESWRCLHCVLSPDDSFPVDFIQAWSRVYRHRDLVSLSREERETMKKNEEEFDEVEGDGSFFSLDDFEASSLMSLSKTPEKTESVHTPHNEAISFYNSEEYQRCFSLSLKREEDINDKEEEKKSISVKRPTTSSPSPPIHSSSSSSLSSSCPSLSLEPCLHVIRAKVVREILRELTHGKMKPFRTTRFMKDDGTPLADEVYRHLLQANHLVRLS